MQKAEFTWFKNAKLNITKNCIDRHLANKGDKTAIQLVTPTKPTYASLPLPGIKHVLMDELRNEIEVNQKIGNLCIEVPWPGVARTIWGDHQRFIDTYFITFTGKYFSGVGALRDEVGYYRIIGRVDDVIIVSGHNLGAAPIEDAVNEHQLIA